jgi:DNA-binding NarL/FixJ family response regulator
VKAEDEGKRIAAAVPDAKLLLFAPGEADIVSIAQDFEAEVPTAATQQTTEATDRVGLSQREVEVLRLLATGRSNQQIADELVISLNTANRHVSNIYAKTGAANRAQAAVYAKEHGVV